MSIAPLSFKVPLVSFTVPLVVPFVPLVVPFVPLVVPLVVPFVPVPSTVLSVPVPFVVSLTLSLFVPQAAIALTAKVSTSPASSVLHFLIVIFSFFSESLLFSRIV